LKINEDREWFQTLIEKMCDIAHEIGFTKTCCINQLHALLDQVFPEFEHVFPNIKIKPLAWAVLYC